jgi:outer membrane biosynthesis protein TonB
LNPIHPVIPPRAATEQQQNNNRAATGQQQSSNRAATEQQQSSNRAATEQQQSSNRATTEQQLCRNSEKLYILCIPKHRKTQYIEKRTSYFYFRQAMLIN